VTVRASDGNGGFALQTFTVQVAPGQSGLVITSTPPFTATVGSPYTYNVTALDQAGQALTWSLLTAPATMSINTSTGQITWTPAVGDIGPQRVSIQVKDVSGLIAQQAYDLTVGPVNSPPTITSSPVTSVNVGDTYRYAVKAADPDGDALSFSLVAAAPRMTIDSRTGVIVWLPQIGDIGPHTITVRATDPAGAFADQTFTLTVGADTDAPPVSIRLSSQTTNIGQTVTIQVLAADSDGIASRQLFINGNQVTLDANGVATFTGTAVGRVALLAQATDLSGNVGTATSEIKVLNPADTAAPFVKITGPADGLTVTYLTNITGTVTDDDLDSWTLAYAPVNSDQFTTFASGTANVTNAFLGTFDPTLLLNNEYTIRLTGTDINGNTASDEITLALTGNAKPGSYQTGATDLQIPLPGQLSLSIQREFNTLDANTSGDLGFGWHICALEPEIHVTTPINPLEQLVGQFAAVPLKEGDKVYITTPDCQRIGFTFKPVVSSSIFGLIGTFYEPRWVADPGVDATLYGEWDRVGLNLSNGFNGGFDLNGLPLPLVKLADGSFVLAAIGVPYNPLGFRLVLKDGTMWHDSIFSGLQDVTDRNGNTLTVTANGITSSSGASVQFVRDANGRITQIIDPAGKSITYAYDAAGNLETMTNQAGLESDYQYLASFAHFLTAANQPEPGCTCQQAGPPMHESYGSDGRLAGITDALGAITQFSYNLAGQTEHVADALGNVSALVYDSRGNVVSQTDPLGATTLSTYDGNDNLLSRTDPRGFTSQFTYDAHKNLTSITDPRGGLVQMAYDSLNDVTRLDMPLGQSYVYGYDPAGHMTDVTDPMGGKTHLTYDSQGRVLTTTDANGHTTTFVYTGNNAQPTTIIYPGDPPQVTILYDAYGRPSAITDANGNTTQFQRDAMGRILSITDALGQVTTFTYTGTNLTSVTDKQGSVTQLAYDADNHLIQITDPAGGVTSYAYDAKGQKIGETDPLGRTTLYSYRPDGKLDTMTDALGNVTHYGYDLSGNQTSVTDANGHTVTSVFDSRNQLISQTDGLGNTWTNVRDLQGRITSQTDANGHTTTFTYDLLNHLLQSVNALGGVTSYAYDPVGNLLSVTDANGHTTQYQYNELDRLVRQINALDGVQTFAYDGVGNLTSQTDELGRTTSFSFDALNRRTGMSDPAGGTQTWTYTPSDQVSSYADQLGRKTGFTYDVLNHLIAVTDPSGAVQHYGYDAVGNLTSSTDPLGHVTLSAYNGINELTSITDPAGAVQSFGYDAVGNRISSTDALGRTMLYRFNAADELTSITDPMGGVTAYGYDAVGNRTSVTDPNGNTSLFAFDPLNRLTQATDPLGHSATFGYDAVGNLTSTTDRNGRLRTFGYDALERQTSENWWANGSIVRTISYAFDAVGNLVSASDPDSHYTFTYDVLDRQTSVDNAGTPNLPHVILTYGHDAVGNVTSVTDNSGVQVASTYDVRNLLTSRTWSGGGIDPARVDIHYDAAGQRTQMDRFSDLAGLNEVARSVATYNSVGELTHLEHDSALGQVFASYDYHFDPARQLASEIINSQETDYTYDRNGELTSATHPGSTQGNATYQWDANGNPQGSGIVIGAMNQVLSDGTFNYAYDNEGNLIQKTEIATGNVTTYTYDYRNRMTDAVTKSAGGIILQQSHYTYDVFDRRIAVTVNGQTIYTVYDRDHAWADYDASGAVKARYLFGDRIDEILARWRPGQGTAWYLTDHLGTVRDILSAAGQIINHIDYDAFGRILTQTNSAAGDRFTFQGREFDAATGLYYYRARYYDPLLKRFLSEDPLGFAAGDANLYRFVGNRPVIASDPTGTIIFEQTLLGAISGIYLGGIGGLVCGITEALSRGWALQSTRALLLIKDSAERGAALGGLIGVIGGAAFGVIGMWSPALATVAFGAYAPAAGIGWLVGSAMPGLVDAARKNNINLLLLRFVCLAANFGLTWAATIGLTSGLKSRASGSPFGEIQPVPEGTVPTRVTGENFRGGPLNPSTKYPGNLEMDFLATVEGEEVMWGKGYIGVKNGRPNPGELPEVDLESRIELNGRWVEVRPPSGGDNLTVRGLNMLIDAYANEFGARPPAIVASLERTNLTAFQEAYAQAIEQGMTQQQAAQQAILQTPAGRARTAVGYGNLEVTATLEEGVPTNVQVIARPN
jgi:RHS repeat-associated protein